MKKLRFFLAAALCVSLLTFAGCGSNNDTAGDNVNDGTVTEENANMNDGNGTDNGTNDGTNNGSENGNNKGDSVAEDMADGAKNAVDDMKDAVDGNDNKDATKAKNGN